MLSKSGDGIPVLLTCGSSSLHRYHVPGERLTCAGLSHEGLAVRIQVLKGSTQTPELLRSLPSTSRLCGSPWSAIPTLSALFFLPCRLASLAPY